MTRPTLVFIHGFMGDPSDWDFVRKQFPDHATVTPTIRAATDWSSGIKQLAEEIPHNAVLVGYSMGAGLSMGPMSTIADRISGLFFVSGNPGIEDREIAGKRYQNDCRIAERIEREPRSDFLSFW